VLGTGLCMAGSVKHAVPEKIYTSIIIPMIDSSVRLCQTSQVFVMTVIDAFISNTAQIGGLV